MGLVQSLIVVAEAIEPSNEEVDTGIHGEPSNLHKPLPFRSRAPSPITNLDWTVCRVGCKGGFTAIERASTQHHSYTVDNIVLKPWTIMAYPIEAKRCEPESSEPVTTLEICADCFRPRVTMGCDGTFEIGVHPKENYCSEHREMGRRDAIMARSPYRGNAKFGLLGIEAELEERTRVHKCLSHMIALALNGCEDPAALISPLCLRIDRDDGTAPPDIIEVAFELTFIPKLSFSDVYSGHGNIFTHIHSSNCTNKEKNVQKSFDAKASEYSKRTCRRIQRAQDRHLDSCPAHAYCRGGLGRYGVMAEGANKDDGIQEPTMPYAMY
ncbi:hypothetical protein OHC33_003256 [Knufia fluminis]|uniref:Uncharacterized protein n=1 Tax=Knufia fluminis TaxID=191047 RepID=A0AAN8EJZ7_9EURO|nr:hypothetical protein OHC33_003256 [Knufia fluminis]